MSTDRRGSATGSSGAMPALARLEESRRRVERRVVELGRAVDGEVDRAQKIRDGFVAVLGVIGMLMTARSVAKTIGRRRRRGEAASGGKRRRAGKARERKAGAD